jgi:putative Ca2+/H+ antiporter (TMEM165/GDT1 family)
VNHVLVALTAFALIVPVELPDKTFVATLVLGTRYRPWPVFFGVVAAFGVQSLVAVVFGRLLTLLPQRPVQLAAAVLFAIGALLLWRSARRAGAAELEQEAEYEQKVSHRQRGPWGMAMASFLLLFAAEWGDLSQLLTAGLVARGGHPVAVFIGAWLGLATVSAVAVMVGRVLLRYIRLSVVQLIGGAVCAVLAVVSVISALS